MTFIEENKPLIKCPVAYLPGVSGGWGYLNEIKSIYNDQFSKSSWSRVMEFGEVFTVAPLYLK